MNIQPLTRHVSASEIPLTRLAGNTRLTEQEKVAEVSRQFESVLLRQIFAEAQKPMLGQGTGGSSAASGIYQDMISEQLADAVSRSGAVGMARSLGKELGHQLGTGKPRPDMAGSSPALTHNVSNS